MLNAIWLVLAISALLVAAATGEAEVKAVIDSIFDSARSAVQLVIGLVGVMAGFIRTRHAHQACGGQSQTENQ